MITRKDIEHLSWLARLELREEEKEKYMLQLNSVLDYFGQLDKVEADVPPTYHVLDISNIFREDLVELSLEQEEALQNAPKKKDGYFQAPRIV
jgi:aspartyl-tRNA(Asn)/glutamyl-tRNA(Gln) amidotransferase subunit C